MVFFFALLFLFLGVHIRGFNTLADILLRLQFFPSVLRFMALFFSLSALGFLLVILLSMLFGRIYCSSICPLGTFQDLVIAVARRLKPKQKRRFFFSPNRKRILRYGILSATILFWISGSLFLVNLLDPFSNFGKLSVAIFQPAYIWLHNLLAFSFERFDIFLLAPKTMHALPWNVVMISGVIFLTIVTMAAWRGRLFCNTICPVGSVLGIFASRPLVQISFNDEACAFCKRCEWVCKAECLDSQNKIVDHSRCINCFNCFASCPNNGIHFALRPIFAGEKSDRKINQNKRQFLLNLTAGVFSLPYLNKYGHAQRGRQQEGRQQQGRQRMRQARQPGMIPIGEKKAVTPPGSLGHDHFTSHCIACYLCVSACPTKVIVPAFYAYGLEGFMQPTLDFHRNYCNHDCIRCTQVCPTGAITRQTEESKKLVRIGEVRFLVESCIVMVDRTDCGACSEHCPTKAVQMVPWRGGLFIPEIHPELCVGCGACEFACPTEPYKAIYVTGLPVHTKAVAIDDLQGPREDEADDFPF